MKLWFVIILAGHVGATWGPLPYGMDECRSRLAEKSAELDTRFAGNATVAGYSRDQIEVRCVWSKVRPHDEH